MTDTERSLADKMFRAPNGKIVLAQLPNPPLAGWAVCAILAALIDHGRAHTGFDRLSSALLLVWAYLEITEGVNWFRRGLGAVVAISVVVGFFS